MSVEMAKGRELITREPLNAIRFYLIQNLNSTNDVNIMD